MTAQIDPSVVHCNNCNYEGKVHASGAKHFVIFLILLASSAFLLPMVVVALGYMVWILSQPPKRMCPKCKSTDLSPVAAPGDQAENRSPGDE